MERLKASDLQILWLAPPGAVRPAAAPTTHGESTECVASLVGAAGSAAFDVRQSEQAASNQDVQRDAHACGPCVFHSCFSGFEFCVEDGLQAGSPWSACDGCFDRRSE